MFSQQILYLQEFMDNIISVCTDLPLTVFNPLVQWHCIRITIIQLPVVYLFNPLQHYFLITVLGWKTVSQMETVVLRTYRQLVQEYYNCHYFMVNMHFIHCLKWPDFDWSCHLSKIFLTASSVLIWNLCFICLDAVYHGTLLLQKVTLSTVSVSLWRAFKLKT
jgi:hypothetical protein